MAGLLTQSGSDPVQIELAHWASTEFRWGQTDCCQSILRYIERNTGRRLEPWPNCSSAMSAKRIIERAGGMASLCRRDLLALGCIEVPAHVRGDIGLVDLPEAGPTLCLCLGIDRWAARAERGIVMFASSAMIAWRLPCRKP